MSNRRLVLSLPSLAVAPRVSAQQSADLIVTSARIYTVDENRPMVEAMTIKTGRMLATGPQRAMMTRRGANTQPPDLIPGTNVLATHLGGRAVFQKPVP